MTRLLQKYKLMIFYDPDDDMTYRLDFCRPAKKNGWEVLRIPESGHAVIEDEWQTYTIRSTIVFVMVKQNYTASRSSLILQW